MKTEPLPRRHGERHRLRHRDQGLPGAGRQRQRRRASRLSRQRREGARARRRVRRQRPSRAAVCSFYGAAAYTDGRYVSFPDAPPPLEDTGGPQVKDISGSVLPGISKWALSLGGEYVASRQRCSAGPASSSAALDASYRSSFSSSASASTLSGGRRLLAAQRPRRLPLAPTAGRSRCGRATCSNKDYFELLTAAPGNTGLYVGQPGRSRGTVGVTLRMSFAVEITSERVA